MDQRTYDQYNQTVLSGTIVLNGLKNYGNSDFAYVVNTLRDTGTKAANYGSALGPSDPEPGWDPFSLNPMEYDISALRPKTLDPDGHTNSERVQTTQYLYTDVKNANTVRATTKADAHYINPTAKFLSVLIHDVNDDIIGMYIEQQITTATYEANKDSSVKWSQDDFLIQNLESWNKASS